MHDSKVDQIVEARAQNGARPFPALGFQGAFGKDEPPKQKTDGGQEEGVNHKRIYRREAYGETRSQAQKQADAGPGEAARHPFDVRGRGERKNQPRVNNPFSEKERKKNEDYLFFGKSSKQMLSVKKKVSETTCKEGVKGTITNVKFALPGGNNSAGSI